MNILKLIETATVVFSVLTIALIIMNQPQSGDNFGSSESFTTTRRGMEKQVHSLTVASSVILLLLVLASQVLK